MSSGIIGKNGSALSGLAKQCGELAARKLFEGRGNNSEVHLSELELALAIATGAHVAMEITKKRVEKELA